MVTLTPDAQLNSAFRIGSEVAARIVVRTTSRTDVNERVWAPVP